MSFFDRLLDPFRGNAITIPPYDGVYKPNNAVDDASEILAYPAPDNLALWQGRTIFSSGPSIFAIVEGVAEKIVSYDADVNALAVFSEDVLVVALDSGKLVILGGRDNGCNFDTLGSQRIVSPTALAALDATSIIVAHGSTNFAGSQWVADLMGKRATGSVWKLNLLNGETTLLADGLAWPSGIRITEHGKIYISEAFAHRIVRVDLSTQFVTLEPVLTKIPGYPGRLSPAQDGGSWLSVFAPRNRLVEFVLQEDAFRRDMVETIDPRHWIAPALSSGTSFLDPLQCGAVRTMGLHKPWAPSRSYGLAIRLNEAFEPVASFHSRSDGKRHGLTSVLDTGNVVLASIKGADAIIDLGKGAK